MLVLKGIFTRNVFHSLQSLFRCRNSILKNNIKVIKCFHTILPGQTLKVIASKEGAVKNIRTLVSSNPYELISEAKVNEKFIFFIKSYEHIVRNQESVINKLSYKSFNFLKSVIKN